MTDPREVTVTEKVLDKDGAKKILALSECPMCGLHASTLCHNFCTYADCVIRQAITIRRANLEKWND